MVHGAYCRGEECSGHKSEPSKHHLTSSTHRPNRTQSQTSSLQSIVLKNRKVEARGKGSGLGPGGGGVGLGRCHHGLSCTYLSDRQTNLNRLLLAVDPVFTGSRCNMEAALYLATMMAGWCFGEGGGGCGGGG